MRDSRCNKERLRKLIDFREKTIYEDIDEITSLENDIKEGIKRYPKDNEDIIYDTQKGIYIDIRTSINAMYSLGLDCNSMEGMYVLGIKYIVDIANDLAYFNILRYVSLGILLGIDKSQLQPLITKLDDEKFDDVLFDYVLSAYGIERAYKSNKVAYPNPYQLLIEIIEVAKTDKERASRLLKEYTEKKWIDGHADCGWKTFHKEPGYTGLWSYDAGVVAKILNLDDLELKASIHYPYDLVHYKDNLKLTSSSVIGEICSSEDKTYIYGINDNHEIEKIIPVQFHECINNVISDYKTLDDKAMWEKYKLSNVWFMVEEYVEERKQELLGFIIVHVLIDMGYIIQIDGKEDIEDYIDSIPNMWKTDDIRVVSFDLGNDQTYLAKLPIDVHDIKLYEISIDEI